MGMVRESTESIMSSLGAPAAQPRPSMAQGPGQFGQPTTAKGQRSDTDVNILSGLGTDESQMTAAAQNNPYA